MSDKGEKAKQFRQFITFGLILIGILTIYNSIQISAVNNSLVTTNALLTAGNVVGAGNGDAAAPSPSGGQAPSAGADINMADLIDDDAVKGDPNAPVTIVEWSDYECPFCERFYSQTEGQIMSNYVDTGKVKFVYRDFPLSFHPQAQKAAEAAECAGEQGKYWEMHEKLFTSGVDGGVASFKQYAADIGLDTTEFNSCLDNGDMAPEIEADMADGQAAGITGTPGFIINGELVSGAQPYANFKAVIDRKLAEAGAN